MTLAECATIRKQQPEEELLRTINDIRIYESRKGGGGGVGVILFNTVNDEAKKNSIKRNVT